MCGRAVLTHLFLQSAVDMMIQSNTRMSKHSKDSSDNNDGQTTNVIQDNYNLSPGMPSVVFHKVDDGSIGKSMKIWGLVPKGGTSFKPLADGLNKHFENLMYNARSDTLYDKHTFRELALKGQTCIWAIDGFYEWKKDSTSSTKQPYFIYRKDDKPLLVPGLWTKVPTGKIVDGAEEMLDTFTLITTDACQPLTWLHHRQPCFVWDIDLALQWLKDPNPLLLRQISEASSNMNSENNQLQWHPVSKQMSKISYQGEDCKDAIKLPKVSTITSFFSKPVNHGTSDKAPIQDKYIKEPPISVSAIKHGMMKQVTSPTQKLKSTSPSKHSIHKKGTITKFFSPRKERK
jgi:putative SOS response-associated peptidase YedK